MCTHVPEEVPGTAARLCGHVYMSVRMCATFVHVCFHECACGKRTVGTYIYVYAVCNRLNMFSFSVVVWKELCLSVDGHVGPGLCAHDSVPGVGCHVSVGCCVQGRGSGVFRRGAPRMGLWDEGQDFCCWYHTCPPNTTGSMPGVRWGCLYWSQRLGVST